MTTQTNRPGAHDFIALEVALQIVGSLRELVIRIRKHEPSLAQQLVRSASSIYANLAEGNGRQGKDRIHFFRIAAGSAEETRVHLRVAVAWRWLEAAEIAPALELIDRELAMLRRLTH